MRTVPYKHFLICALLGFAGCRSSGTPSTKAAAQPLQPRHWDVGDAVFSHPLPDGISDGLLEFGKSESLGFGVTIARERISQRRHAHSDLLLYVHSGVARVHAGDQDFTAATGDVVFIPRGTAYYADATSRRQLEMLTVYSPPLDSKDVEFLESAESVPIDTTRRPRIITKTTLTPDSLRDDSLNLEKEIQKMRDYQEIDDGDK